MGLRAPPCVRSTARGSAERARVSRNAQHRDRIWASHDGQVCSHAPARGAVSYGGGTPTCTPKHAHGTAATSKERERILISS